MQAVAVNLTLWSLSTEFWVNFIGAVFHSRRMMTVLLVLSSLVLGISIIYGLPTEYGLLALSRTCLGFNAGMLVRKYSNRLVHHRKRLILSAISLIPLFHLAGQTTFAIFLAVPLFSILTLEISKAEPHLMTTKFQNICNFLGRNSFGIYVWQVPINSLVQARNITTLFNLNESSPTTFFLVVLVKFSAILAISELTTRFYEEPIQALLRSSTFSKK
jgi:peptidoglycan/LPS O-acetylase OafA/YrhL